MRRNALISVARQGATTIATARLALATVGLATVGLATVAGAQSPAPTVGDTARRVRVGGFVDGYYAWDIGRPPSRDRSFAGGALFGTQPARHNEFNVNLAFIDATLEAPRHRGRLALQFGTSVQANYAGEPTTGRVSGPGVQQFLQEAFGGVRLGPRTWVDGGIFFSNMGMEGWISRDNPSYTRSLVADYSPYYSTGVRVVHQPTAALAVRLDVVNGWQTISENNQGKGAGVRVDWTPASRHLGHTTTLSYYNLASEEAGSRLRLFNGVGANVTRGRWTLVGEADVGMQRRSPAEPGWSRWYGWMALARVRVRPAMAIVTRLERFADPDQVILTTGARTLGALSVPNAAFQGTGASVGVDVQAVPGALWRTELRGLRAARPLFPNGGAETARREGGFAVTSLAVTF